jgi:hypothetical protein
MVDPEALMWPQLWRGQDGQVNQRLLLASCARGRNQQPHLTLPQQATLQKNRNGTLHGAQGTIKGGNPANEGCYTKEILVKELSGKVEKNERQKSRPKESSRKFD